MVHSECSKVSYDQPKNQHFFNNQQPKFCAKVNRDAHFGTKINTFTFYKWGLGQYPPEAKEM